MLRGDQNHSNTLKTRKDTKQLQSEEKKKKKKSSVLGYDTEMFSRLCAAVDVLPGQPWYSSVKLAEHFL